MAKRRALPALSGLAFVWLVASPWAAHGQVFLASRPHPGFTIGPLFVVASLSNTKTFATPIRVSWTVVPAAGQTLEPGDDLYLLWPGAVSSRLPGGPPDPDLARAIEGPGVTITASGRLPLSARSASDLGTRTAPAPVGEGAPFVTFFRQSGSAGRASFGSYIRIPWSPRLADPEQLMILEFFAHKLVRHQRRPWIQELFFGRRYDVSLSFNNVRSLALFPLYFRQRDRLVHLGDDLAQLLISFQQADSLQLDEISPSTANHQPSESARNTELVSLVIDRAESLNPQVVRVRFGYFSGILAVIPVVVTLGFFALGNLSGPLLRALAQRAWIVAATRLHVGRRRAEAARTSGVVLSRAVLDRIRPGESTYEDVVRLCGPGGELHESLTSPEHRTLAYRGRRLVPHRRRSFGWLATISHWDIENHEVVVEFEHDRVRDVQAGVRRVRGVPETA
jgi:hypothetical protein